MKCTHSLLARKRPCLGQNGWVFFPFFRKRRDSSSKHNAQTGTPCLLWAQMQKINLLHLLGPISQLVLEHDAYTGQQQGTWMGPTRAGARRNRTPPDIRQGSGVRRDCGEFSDKHGGPGGQREEPGKSVLSFNFCYVHKAPACTRRACFHNNPAALFLMWHHHAVFASQQRSPPPGILILHIQQMRTTKYHHYSYVPFSLPPPQKRKACSACVRYFFANTACRSRTEARKIAGQ